MTKKKIDLLNEVKKKSLKICTLIKKIDESDKLGMVHRHKEYVESLDETFEQINNLYKEFKNV